MPFMLISILFAVSALGVLIVDNVTYTPHKQHTIAVKTATLYATQTNTPFQSISCDVVPPDVNSVPCYIQQNNLIVTKLTCEVSKQNTRIINRTYCIKDQ